MDIYDYITNLNLYDGDCYRDPISMFMKEYDFLLYGSLRILDSQINNNVSFEMGTVK